MSSLTKLYPPLKPYRRGRLRVSAIHEIYFEEYGDPRAPAAVYLHGGPGGGSKPAFARFFNPAKWRVILFDQRGCGKSAPNAELRENTTWDLVADMERLRVHLGIADFLVCGGSWGSALALAYAQRHPAAARALILRGVFTLRRAELEWFYQEGASWIYPDLWEEFIAPIPRRERADLIAAYYRRLTGSDKKIQLRCARAWSRWEGATLSLNANPARVKEFGGDRFALAFARIEAHYFFHRGFFRRDDQLIRDARKIRRIPTVIIHGRYDIVTPLKTAWELARALPDAELQIIPAAGHAADEAGIAAAIVKAANRFAKG